METQKILFVVGGGMILLLVAALLLVLLLGVPWQAYRRGHGFFSWFILQILAFNPVFPLVLIALLPDRSKSRLRARFSRELDDLLRDSKRHATILTLETASPLQSVGDLPTAGTSVGDPSLSGDSVGDLPTELP